MPETLIGPQRMPYCWQCGHPSRLYCIGCQHTLCFGCLTRHDTQAEIDHPEIVLRWETPQCLN